VRRLRHCIPMMDLVRVGRTIRAIRIKKRWRQVDLAARANVSQSLVARIERGRAGRVRIDTLARVVAALDARMVVRVDWQGEGADRLLDAGHAALVEQVIGILRAAGWEAIPEVTFAIDGERGSVDILAWHSATATALIVEIKTVVPDVQGLLAPFDRKVRRAGSLAAARGWRVAKVGALLVIAESRTSRRRVEAHASTFASRFAHGATDTRRFLNRPGDYPALRGLWFLSPRTRVTTRHRVSGHRALPERVAKGNRCQICRC
jgi:transcriptional regulator with XRE-family HTH domain